MATPADKLFRNTAMFSVFENSLYSAYLLSKNDEEHVDTHSPCVMKPGVEAHSLTDRIGRYISKLHGLFAAIIAVAEAKLWSHALRNAIGKEFFLSSAVTGNVFIVVLFLSLLLSLVVYIFQLLSVLFIVQSIDVAYCLAGNDFF